MNDIKQISPQELIEVAGSYIYNPADFFELEDKLKNRIENYAGSYGVELHQHLKRTSDSLKQFMNYKRMDENVVLNISHAFLFHDTPKIWQPPAYWNIDLCTPSEREQLWTEDGRPTKELKILRMEHATRAPEFFESIVQNFPLLKGHPHLSVMTCEGHYHHERLNGVGPMEFSGTKLGLIGEMMGIVDEYDGKIRPRKDRRQKTSEEVLNEMAGKPSGTGEVKHSGEFRLSLLDEFRDSIPELALKFSVPGPATLAM